MNAPGEESFGKMITVYGIPNCDTIKKTLTWLKANGIPFRFHDYRKDGITADRIGEWLKSQPLEKVLNKASTTWKGLTEEEKESAQQQAGAVAIMVQQPSMIKRPLIEDDNGKVIAIGYAEKTFELLFR